MITVSVHYKNGDYEEFTSTSLPFCDGYTIQNDMLRISDIEKNGVVWELSYFATKDEDPEDEGGTISTHTIVKPENLENISMIMMNGNIIYPPENFETEEETELDV